MTSFVLVAFKTKKPVSRHPRVFNITHGYIYSQLRHTLALWQRAMALVQSLVVQTLFASFRPVS